MTSIVMILMSFNFFVLLISSFNFLIRFSISGFNCIYKTSQTNLKLLSDNIYANNMKLVSFMFAMPIICICHTT